MTLLARSFVAVLVALLFGLACAPVQAKCQIGTVELPLTMVGLRPLVTARINDVEVKLILDSGDLYSHVSSAAAAQLDLPRHRAPYGLQEEGIGGAETPDVVRVARFVLRKTVIPNIEFLVAQNELDSGAIGTLGQNILGAADIEYDLANGVVRIAYPNDECDAANPAYWAGSKPVVALDLEKPFGNRARHTVVMGVVNGAKIRLEFDSGAPTSFLSLRAAKRAGIVPDGEGVIPGGDVFGFGRHLVKTWIAPVKTFAIGTEQISNTHLRIGELDLSEADMLLGADFMLAHRIYVANGQGRLYFTYNGGPVFNLGVFPAAVLPPGESSASPSQNADASAAALDAAGFARRGAAFASRRDYDHAIADLTQACEMEPKVGKYFSERGRVQWMRGRQSLAMSDFDEALRLDPTDVDARLARASLHGIGHDIASARADLQVLDQAVPSQAPIRLAMGNLYLQLGMPELAIPQYNQWIAAHADDVNLPGVRNQRCRARALLGVELHEALDDCKSAVKAKSDSAQALESRALVYLRMGEIDKALADYDKALHINPKSAWSLYGRGLTELRKGAAKDGAADIAAAKAIQPTIEDDAKRYGLGQQQANP